MAQRISRPATAFSKDKPARQTRGRYPQTIDKHRRWIKSLPSIVSGEVVDVDPHHVNRADPSAAKPGRGKGRKVDDLYLIPCSRRLHDEIHSIGERAFESKYLVDLVKIAMALYQNSGDDGAGELIVNETMRAK